MNKKVEIILSIILDLISISLISVFQLCILDLIGINLENITSFGYIIIGFISLIILKIIDSIENEK